MGAIMFDEENGRLKYLSPDTYKDKLLSISAQRMIFVIYHIMNLRNGDNVPNLERLNAVGNEHGVQDMDLEELICYERWLRQGEL